MSTNSVAELASRLMTAVFMPVASDSEAVSFLKKITRYPPISCVFVDPVRISMAADILKPAGIEVGTEAAYPLGNTLTEAKVASIRYAIRSAAAEIDVGANFVAIKSGDFAALKQDTCALVEAAGDNIRLVPILETAILSKDEIQRTLDVFKECHVNTIKTSSGYGWNTAFEDVLLILRRYGDSFKIDVSGGVRTCEDVRKMLEAGVHKIHTSRVLAILDMAMEDID